MRSLPKGARHDTIAPPRVPPAKPRVAPGASFEYGRVGSLGRPRRPLADGRRALGRLRLRRLTGRLLLEKLAFELGGGDGDVEGRLPGVEELLALATADAAGQVARLVVTPVLDHAVGAGFLQQLAAGGRGAEGGNEQGRAVVGVARLQVYETRLLRDQVLDHLEVAEPAGDVQHGHFRVVQRLQVGAILD